MGESYMQVDKAEIESLLEKDEQRINVELDKVDEKIKQAKKTMAELKVKLYAKFGTSINLEEE